MKTFTIEGFAHCQPAKDYQHGDANCVDGFVYGFSAIKFDHCDYICAGTATLIIAQPKNFDPRCEAVKELEKQKKAIKAAFQARITEIDRQISQFQAITNEVKV